MYRLVQYFSECHLSKLTLAKKKNDITLPLFLNQVKETRLHLCKFDAERAIPSSFTINTYNLSRMLKLKSKQNKSLSTSTVERFSFISDNSSGLRTLRIKY